MGVNHLLPLLKYARRRVHFARTVDGWRIYVDGFVWLHEAVTHHAREVVLNKNFTPVVTELVWRCLQYLNKGRRIVIVLDGKRHASKHSTNEARLKRRVLAQAAVDLALEDDEENITIDDSTLKIAAAVSEDLVNALIDGLRKNGIAHIRAPYEADGELAYLSLQHPDDSLVYTCDSDLHVLGAPRVAMSIKGPDWSSQHCHLYLQADILNPVIPSKNARTTSHSARIFRGRCSTPSASRTRECCRTGTGTSRRISCGKPSSTLPHKPKHSRDSPAPRSSFGATGCSSGTY